MAKQRHSIDTVAEILIEKVEDIEKAVKELKSVSLKMDTQKFEQIPEQNKAILDVLSDFKDFTPELGEKSIKTLQKVLNGVQNVDIPAKVEIENRQKIDFSDRTRKFLIWFFCISSLVIGSALYFAFWAYTYEYKPKAELKRTDKQIQWLEDYNAYMYERNPKTHNAFVSENPYPRD